MSTVQTGPLPDHYRALYGTGSPPPWIEAEKVVAVLFYATDADAVMGTNGVMPDGRNTKILWLLDDLRGPLSVVGAEAGSDQTFRQTWQSDAAQHATHVEVPSPGCWTLSASVAGVNAGSVTIRVVGS